MICMFKLQMIVQINRQPGNSFTNAKQKISVRTYVYLFKMQRLMVFNVIKRVFVHSIPNLSWKIKQKIITKPFN